MELMNLSCEGFLEELASKAAAPGGGGASALVGAAGVALGSMVGSLTVGKKKYAAVEADIIALNVRAEALRKRLEALVQADADAFAPLAAAYGLPKDTPEQAAHKASVLETALDGASAVPLQIMEKCADLLPDYFSFVKGIVDSQDLSLNISREMLQKDNQLKLIHNALEKKIKNELHSMLVNDREKYEAFWKEFGRQIKFGAYSDYGMHAELLRDLLLFWSAKEQKMVTLQEYIDKMSAEQKYIYFAAGDSTDRLAKLPSAELVLDKGFDVLLLTEDVDEFCLQILHSYPRKDAEGKDGTVEFKNVNSGDLGLETEDEKKAAEDATAENKPLFDAMKDALDGKVKEVKVSTRLKDHPVCLSADGPLSIEMEKVLSKQPGSEGVKSDKVLELNINHPVFAVLKAAQEAGDTDKVKKYSSLLYAQAQLIEGLPVDDPAAYAEAVCSLMK